MQKILKLLKRKKGTPFKTAMLAIKNQLNEMDSVDEKITLLKFTRMAIISELALSSINSLLYTGKFAEWEDRFPYLLSGMNREHYYELLDDTCECDLSKNKVVSYPWHIDRYFNAFLIIAQEDFRYDELNHMISYYPQLNLYVAYNGLHSISAGVLSQNGTLPCNEVYDLTKMFENIHTEDGLQWVHTDGFVVGEIPDFRFALIFEISRLLRELE
ncbi:MAG: hypothetical protein PHY15_06540 [Eubacteriales bacterium]|nr:hypothetical protein [Eubacteriales bacterium]